MPDHDEIDRRLRSYAERWRDTLPESRGPVVPPLPRRGRAVRWLVPAVAAAVVLAVVLAATSNHQPHGRQVRYGPPFRQAPVKSMNATVEGWVQLVGDGLTTPRHVPGTITVRSQFDDDIIETLRTDARGHYVLVMPPGRYLLSATSPKYDDGKGTCVTDATGQIGNLDVIERDLLCHLK